MLSLSSQVSPAVLSALDDSDPAVCQHLWDAVLSVLNSITVRKVKVAGLSLYSVIRNNPCFLLCGFAWSNFL